MQKHLYIHCPCYNKIKMKHNSLMAYVKFYFVSLKYLHNLYEKVT
jgi:hypothetical protein